MWQGACWGSAMLFTGVMERLGLPINRLPGEACLAATKHYDHVLVYVPALLVLKGKHAIPICSRRIFA
jgi:hypothetical protein